MLFTFRSRYYYAIGRSGVLSLGGWSPRIHTGFHVSGATRDYCERLFPFGYRALTFCGWPSHAIRLKKSFVTLWASCGRPCRSHNTNVATAATLALHRFRLFPVRSPLLRESSFLYFPAGTEMFQFPAFPALSRYQEMSPGRFPDLGYLRIIAYLAASRSFSQLCHVLRRL